MIDNRLLGTWRSDLRKTEREARRFRDLTNAQRAQFKRIFGKLRIRYTRTRAYYDLMGHQSVDLYRVVAKDDSSVAIVAPGPFGVREQIWHIHFEGNYHWVWCPLASHREYFRRIDL